jgi:hypothetical protein
MRCFSNIFDIYLFVKQTKNFQYILLNCIYHLLHILPVRSKISNIGNMPIINMNAEFGRTYSKYKLAVRFQPKHELN